MFGARVFWPRLVVPVAASIAVTLALACASAAAAGRGAGGSAPRKDETPLAFRADDSRGKTPVPAPPAAPVPAPHPNAPQGEHLRCVFEVTRETIPTPFAGAGPGQVARVRPGKEPPQKEVFKLIVGLERDRFVCEDPGGTPEVVAFHFPSRRVTELDLTKKTFRDLSLYAIVAFRVNESINRFAFAASFARGRGQKPEGNLAQPSDPVRKMDDPDPAPPDPDLVRCIDRFAVETLYSLRIKSTPAHPAGVPFLEKPVIQAVARPLGQGWEFVHDDTTAVQFVPSERTVPRPFLRSLRHFLAYRCAIHPEIRETILGTGKLPATLSYRSVELFGRTDQTVTLKLASATLEQGAWPGVPAGFTPAFDANDPLDVIARKLEKPDDPAVLVAANPGQGEAEGVGAAAARKLPQDRAALGQFIDEAIKASRFFDAYLGWCEYASRTGDPAPELGARISAANFAPLNTIAAGFPATREAAEQRVKDLDAVDRKGLAFGYMLDVLSGSTLNTINRTLEAEARWLKALEVNPRLTSVLVQLGHNRFRGYAMTDAWRCFDAARKVAPNAPMLADISQLEARFARDYPDEF